MLVMRLKVMNLDTVLEAAREYFGFLNGHVLVIEPRHLDMGSMILIESRYGFIYEAGELRKPTEEEFALFEDPKA